MFRDRLARLPVDPCLDAAPEDDAVALVIYGVCVGLHLSSRTFALQLGFAGGLAILSIALIDEVVNVIGGNRPTYERGSPDETPEEFVERISQGGGG